MLMDIFIDPVYLKSAILTIFDMFFPHREHFIDLIISYGHKNIMLKLFYEKQIVVFLMH